MIIVDPVALGDAACTRPSPKWVFDRTGTLVEVPPNTLAVTYDPADLSAAPYALIEGESTNFIRNNTMQGAAPGVMPTNWSASVNNSGAAGMNFIPVGAGVEDGIEYMDIQFVGTSNLASSARVIFEIPLGAPAAVLGDKLAAALFMKIAEGRIDGASRFNLVFDELRSDRTYFAGRSYQLDSPTNRPLREQQFEAQHEIFNAETAYARAYISIFVDAGVPMNLTVRFGLPRVERNKITSLIKTSLSAVTRAADVISNTAGLIYSNVPMVEPPYSAATTYAKDAAVYDPATKIVYWSMQAGNVGKPLSDGAWWNKRTAINRWAMFDDRNSTVTSNPEEIIAVVSARAITQGLFAGALDASEVLVSMTHPTRGLVYSEKRNLVLPRSGSSFFGWCFNRLRMRTWFLTLALPVFANALVTITIRKPGSVAKCGMCLQGAVVESGRSLIGLGTELKDYSSTTFFADGSSETTERGFSKRMSVDVMVETDRVEELEDYLSGRRQKTLVYLASTTRGDTMLVGKFSSLRKVIGNFRRSTMSLQIEGVLNR
ncbi:hypothetical protein [Telluria beijingensis]|uniref:hypothetical protein n=1 Tax=Telluria beijingensis TaxID=3068633 RepID=UPI002795CA27|nr:hypothetical protein [Massilia sp. REN29]